MKIFVKTLKGARFEIQVNPEDSVADVKKSIETVLGVTAAEQVLIHKGNVLRDETTLETNNVSEKSIIGVMKRKPASTGTSSTSSASLESQDDAAHPSSAELAWDDGLDLNYESISESNIQLILEMVRGAWSRKLVTGALRLACNDVDKALEYLYFDLPAQLEDPFITEGTQESDAHEKADLRRSLDSLLHTPEFEYILAALMPSDPSIVNDFVEMVEEHDPPLFQLIQNNKAYFLRLLLEVEGGTGGNEMEQPHELQAVQTNEPNNGGDGGNQVGESEETEVEQPPQELQADQTNEPNKGGGDGSNQVGGESEETEVEVATTPEDYELIGRLEALGFERSDAEVAYFACNKNVQAAADQLLGSKHEPQE